MFKVDLLKGQGVPIRSRPEGIAVAAVTFAVPIVIAIIMFGIYMSNKIVMSVQKQDIASYNERIKSDKLWKAVELQEAFEDEKVSTNSHLEEVSESVVRYTQWSPILLTLVKSMPESAVLTKLTVKQRSIRKKVPQKGDPTKMVDVSLPAISLQMKICGTSKTGYDEEIKKFRDRLRSSAYLGPKLEDIIVSQGFDKVDGRDVVAYDIDCIFRPEL
ncbi:MAG: hypothetical protein KAJ19_17795 [Gammaproteobacteria bacterium]|nr:hypothetical protein [Gammaproteobacteria bacterium]